MSGPATALHLVALQPARPEDAGYMALAIDEARRSRHPFGAVIVRDGIVLAGGGNRGAERDDPTAHGEMVTIHAALAAHGAGSLKGATLYTTGEPCPMCMGAILWCGFGRLVYAASIGRLATRLHQIAVPCTALAAAAGFAPISITGDVLSDEAMALFR